MQAQYNSTIMNLESIGEKVMELDLAHQEWLQTTELFI